MFALLSTISTGLEITALLFALNFLANAIRFIYNMTTNTIRFIRFIAPIIVHCILVTADFISWVNSFIDWHFTLQVILDCLKVIGTAAYVAGEFCGKHLYRWHASWTGTISYEVAPVAPAINPLFDMADELMTMTCKDLRSTFGLKQRTNKALLVAAALAI